MFKHPKLGDMIYRDFTFDKENQSELAVISEVDEEGKKLTIHNLADSFFSRNLNVVWFNQTFIWDEAANAYLYKLD